MNRILLEGTQNTRYLTGKLIRSDRLDKLTERDIASLLEWQATTVIDLRRPKDRASAVMHDRRFSYHTCSIRVSPWNEQAAPAHQSTEELLLSQYLEYLDQQAVICEIMRIILQAQGKVILFCHYGKDRTGVISALLLMLAGRPEQEIVQDYALSGENLKGIEADERSKRFIAASSPEIMRQFLREFRSTYPTAEAYFRQAGLEDAEIQLLKAQCR